MPSPDEICAETPREKARKLSRTAYNTQVAIGGRVRVGAEVQLNSAALGGSGESAYEYAYAELIKYHIPVVLRHIHACCRQPTALRSSPSARTIPHRVRRRNRRFEMGKCGKRRNNKRGKCI